MQDMCLQRSDDGSMDGSSLKEWQEVSLFSLSCSVSVSFCKCNICWWMSEWVSGSE